MNSTIVAQNDFEIKQEISEQDQLFRNRYKIDIPEQIGIYEQLQDEPGVTSKQVLGSPQKISVGQMNRIRREWELQRKAGRPHKPKDSNVLPSMPVLSHLPQAGVSLLQMWLEEKQIYEPILERIHQMIEHYRQQHPDERFRLLQSKPQTIAKKWQALTILPLLDIGKLSELDYKPHNMREILGYHYGSSSLTQFLGELERIGAAELKLELANCATGDYCYIDGHMIAFWSLLKMHKGKITMLGRIMPGSKAVIAHDESGSAIGLEYYPPDTHLSKIIEDYCSAIELTTGIKNFIIDREVNSVDIAKLFVLRDWNLICLLDSNEYKGAESFSKRFVGRLDDGSSLYKATWSCYHEGDPRKFVVVQETNRCLVYWTTPDIFNKLTALQIVKYYRSRAEIQENNIKRMIAHGELNTNFGNKKVYGEDRTQKRKMEKLDEKLGKLQAKEQKFEQAITTQQVKIQSSEDSGHNQRLIQRTAKLEQIQQQKNEVTQKISKVEEKKQQLGAPAVRADRDFRKQTIMTFRTLWLENVIKALFSLIFNALKQPLDIEIALDLLFFRTADRIESHDEILYYLSTKDLSNKYQEILFRLIAGFNEIGLFYKGKQVHVYASEFV